MVVNPDHGYCPALTGVGEEEDCPGVTTNPISWPNWVHTWVRTVRRPRSTASARNHAFHPLGFSWVVKAEEGGLTQAQHTAFKERKCLEGEAGVRQPSPTALAGSPQAPKSHLHLHSQYPQGPHLTSPLLETGTGRAESQDPSTSPKFSSYQLRDLQVKSLHLPECSFIIREMRTIPLTLQS